MDATFFPYNSMFTAPLQQKNTASTHAIKINGKRVAITKHLYWKKDFLEETLFNYSKYIQNGEKLFMQTYLDLRIADESNRRFLLRRLCPNAFAMRSWLNWYAGYAGASIEPGSNIELMRYDVRFEKNAAVLTDSVIIYKYTAAK